MAHVDLFENDVKTYGTQAHTRGRMCCLSFENDVKTYGTQATRDYATKKKGFENDVKTYGTQAARFSLLVHLGLRMM